jgi:RNA polymerase sigma-70 factor (ECF subfamily)
MLQRRLLEPLTALLDGRSPLPDPERSATLRTELGRTLRALRRLPGRDREALLLVGAGDLGPTEGARVLGISVSALKMRVHRARQRLLRLLEAGDGKRD